MVNTYAGKKEISGINRRVSRKISPSLRKMHAENGPPTTRKGGGK